MKVGDLIFWHLGNTIALVLSVDTDHTVDVHKNLWVYLLEDGMIAGDDLSDGYTIIDKNWNWPKWHINHRSQA